jgi:hypothetical protein
MTYAPQMNKRIAKPDRGHVARPQIDRAASKLLAKKAIGVRHV